MRSGGVCPAPSPVWVGTGHPQRYPRHDDGVTVPRTEEDRTCVYLHCERRASWAVTYDCGRCERPDETRTQKSSTVLSGLDFNFDSVYLPLSTGRGTQTHPGVTRTRPLLCGGPGKAVETSEGIQGQEEKQGQGQGLWKGCIWKVVLVPSRPGRRALSSHSRVGHPFRTGRSGGVRRRRREAEIESKHKPWFLHSYGVPRPGSPTDPTLRDPCRGQECPVGMCRREGALGTPVSCRDPCAVVGPQEFPRRIIGREG